MLTSLWWWVVNFDGRRRTGLATSRIWVRAMAELLPTAGTHINVATNIGYSWGLHEVRQILHKLSQLVDFSSEGPQLCLMRKGFTGLRSIRNALALGPCGSSPTSRGAADVMSLLLLRGSLARCI
jgi:hypothetical protein